MASSSSRAYSRGMLYNESDCYVLLVYDPVHHEVVEEQQVFLHTSYLEKRLEGREREDWVPIKAFLL